MGLIHPDLGRIVSTTPLARFQFRAAAFSEDQVAKSKLVFARCSAICSNQVMAIDARISDTRLKALAINLDPGRYGTFAEIGAGQEVSRWFFRVGGAAGTIAKSISTYDMKVSDVRYGPADRYVSRERLIGMLHHEHAQCLDTLADERGDTTAFFTFADTVAAASYRGTGECHAWLGIRFQESPGADDSQIVLHLRMLDAENLQQQEALGIVGVNLIYGACHHSHEPEQILASLLDAISLKRIEIDMIEFSGTAFSTVDNPCWRLERRDPSARAAARARLVH